MRQAPWLAWLLMACAAVAEDARDPVIVTIDTSQSVAVSRFRPGVTHTQYTATSGNSDAVASARELLPKLAVFQNQHIMGWGAMNPEPSPGVYDWKSLDQRMGLMRETGAIPVITLCCAPDWMKGGTAGQTDWSKLETAPLPEHFDDFAELARQVALRYPDVLHYQVWNEFKGFWNRERNRWNYEAYTDLYNRVYQTLKSVNPEIKVGGPYIVMRKYSSATAAKPFPAREPELRDRPYGVLEQRPLDAIAYWLDNKAGADFLAVDGRSFTWEAPDPDPIEATVYFADATAWLLRRTDLPIWWAEWYTTPYGQPEQWEHSYQNVVMATALLHMIRSRASVALQWGPQGVAGQPYEGNNESIWSDVRAPGGGQPFPFARTQQLIMEHFPPGTDLYEISSNAPYITGLATDSVVFLINRSQEEAGVQINGSVVTLPGYGVAIAPLK